MSDEQKHTANIWGGNIFKIAMVVLGFLAASTFNDMKDTVKEIKSDVKEFRKEIGDKVDDTHDDVITLKDKVDIHNDRLNKLESRGK